jgi:hypothetical protein
MKATIEIPDELYRQVKAKSALESRTIREVTIELYQIWVKQDAPLPDERSPEQMMEDLFKLADELMAGAPPGPTARELLEEDRNRLERY